MIFCNNCGTKLNNYERFCTNCGATVSSQQTSDFNNDLTLRYFISINHNSSGPYTLEQLQPMIQSGEVTPDHWICPENSDTWVRIDQMPDLSAFFRKQPSPAIVKTSAHCNNCGKKVAKTAKFCVNCGSAVADGAPMPPAPVITRPNFEF